MKKLAFLTFAAFALSANPVNVNHLTQADMNEILQNPDPELAVEFPVDTLLPITFFLKGDVATIDGQEVRVKRTFYIRCVGEELLFSTDMIEWKSMLEFLTGTASATLNIQDGRPAIACGVEANLR